MVPIDPFDPDLRSTVHCKISNDISDTFKSTTGLLMLSSGSFYLTETTREL